MLPTQKIKISRADSFYALDCTCLPQYSRVVLVKKALKTVLIEGLVFIMTTFPVLQGHMKTSYLFSRLFFIFEEFVLAP